MFESQKPSIDISNVSLSYERSSRLTIFFNKNLRKTKRFQALDNISFAIGPHETVGIIGRNGSGKSTISRLMAGILKPSEGKVSVSGKVQLLALGVGFKPQLTGIENVFISGALLGMSRAEIKAHLSDIEEFTELGEFLDEPVRTYSSGMKSRLGFAVSTVVQPDILILDEVFSTGDNAFRSKALARIEEMKSKTKIVVLISHNPNQIKQMCTRVIWLDKGQIIMDKDPRYVLDHYDAFSKRPHKWLIENKEIVKIESNTESVN